MPTIKRYGQTLKEALSKAPYSQTSETITIGRDDILEIIGMLETYETEIAELEGEIIGMWETYETEIADLEGEIERLNDDIYSLHEEQDND